MAITRTIPDVRSANVDKTVGFYTEFLGFGVRREGDQVTGFVSQTDPEVEVTLNLTRPGCSTTTTPRTTLVHPDGCELARSARIHDHADASNSCVGAKLR